MIIINAAFRAEMTEANVRMRKMCVSQNFKRKKNQMSRQDKSSLKCPDRTPSWFVVLPDPSPPGWSHRCNSISSTITAQRGAPRPEPRRTASVSIKNRSIARNQIQRREEIPDEVARYADHTATEAAARGSLFIALFFPQRGELGSRRMDTSKWFRF